MNKELNGKQNAKLNMSQTTAQHLDENDSIIASNPALKKALAKLKANNAAIIAAAAQKSGSLTGIAADKNSAKTALCKFAATIAGAVFAYALENADLTLKHEMDLPVTELMRTLNQSLAPRCQNIHDRAAAHLAELDDYGITPAHLADLQTAIDDYAAQTVKPRAAVSSRKTVNAKIIALFKENDDLLTGQIDKLIALYRQEQPDFVQTYESARIIVDPPTRPRQLKETPVKKTDEPPK